MPRIRLLDKNVYELIAAGEVVERPVSVVKELVENSIDAGSTSIEVELVSGGLKSIRVKDNGCGISRSEIPLAFLRHATSKIQSAIDLDCIDTLGFRGEALASIAAVSRIRLYSASAGETGTEYIIEGGEEISISDAGVPEGTTIIVEDLFYNTPARMKFLKKDIYESNAVQTLLEQLLLSHPEISFRFIRDGKTVFNSPGDGNLYSALCYIWPSEVTDNLIDVNDTSDGISIYGYISNPIAARKSRSMQSLFVNNRYIVSRSITSAIEEAADKYYMVGKRPAFVLFISIPSSEIDINVHPAKTEIRFANERKVTSLAYSAVKMSLESYTTSPENYLGKTASADSEPVSDFIIFESSNSIPVSNRPEAPKTVSETADLNNNYSDNEYIQEVLDIKQTDEVLSDTSKKEKYHFLDISVDTDDYESRLNRIQKKEDYINVNTDIISDNTANPSFDPSDDVIIHQTISSEYEFRYVGELFKTYIVLECGDRMVLIDKHAAHERLMYDRFVAEGTDNNRQVLLTSVIVSLSSNEIQAVEDNFDLLARIGFVIDVIGNHEVAVREIPVYYKSDKIKDAVEQLASALVSMKNDVTTDEEIWLLHSSACRSAIKGGNISSDRELIDLAERIINGNYVMQCPHGRPVCTFITQKELERRFGRIQ